MKARLDSHFYYLNIIFYLVTLVFLPENLKQEGFSDVVNHGPVRCEPQMTAHKGQVIFGSHEPVSPTCWVLYSKAVATPRKSIKVKEHKEKSVLDRSGRT